MRQFALEWWIAWRYLRSRRKERWISIVGGFSFFGIFLGVATLIVVMSVMNGFRSELFARILAMSGHAEIGAYDGLLDNHNRLSERIRQSAKEAGFTVEATPLIEGQVLYTANGRALGGVLRGVSQADWASVAGRFAGLSLRPQAGNRGTPNARERPEDLPRLPDEGGIVIGTRMAESLQVALGETIAVVSPIGQSTAFGLAPRLKRYRITGFFEVGMYEYDRLFAFVSFSEAARFFRTDGHAHRIELRGEVPEQVQKLTEAVSPVLEGEAPNLYIRSWQEINGSFYEAIRIERNVMFLILTLMIVVAAFNIVSGQVMLVNDKSAGIAVLRSLGASRYTILRIFLITGACIGITGTVLGVAAGVAFAVHIEAIKGGLESLFDTRFFGAEVYFLSRLPSEISVPQITGISLMALAFSLLASLYPAFRAASFDPIRILRHE